MSSAFDPRGEPPLCDVVIPCRDEALALPLVLAEVPPQFRVIVVDNGSTDATAEVARNFGALVVHEAREGYGAAVHAGVLAASAEFVAVLDGDGSMRLSDLLPMLEILRAGRADLVVCRRRPAERGVWPLHARAGTVTLAWWIRRRSGLPIHDLAPMRVCRRHDLLALGVRDRRFGYPLELMVRAADAGWTVVEREVDYFARAAGTKSKVSGSVKGTARVMRDFAGVLR